MLDEIHRMPELFTLLRPLIDKRRREGETAGQFLLLGSALLDVARGASETLAGRIAHFELGSLDLLEVREASSDRDIANRLWLRGGFPDSFLARSDAESRRWRDDLIRSLLERDVGLFAPRMPVETLRRFWTMLAHQQGGLFNASQYAASLGYTHKTTQGYLDLFVDLLIVRRLEPWLANVGKRLVKAPKVYVRDSGLLHALLGLERLDDLLAHPVAGTGWEGLVIENVLAVAPAGASAGFYRTGAGAEIDLVLEFDRARYAIEIKRSLSPAPSKGFHVGAADIPATHKLVVYPGAEVYPLGSETKAMPVETPLQQLLRGRRGR